MTEINTKQIAINECGGAENYYKELNALISDVQFFEMYMKRETKSSFQFSVAIKQAGSLNAFEDLRKNLGKYKTDDETLESVFDDFLCLKRLIKDLYSDNDKQCKLTKTEIETLVHYFERYRELDLTNYVSDFIGCSRGCIFVIDKIRKIRDNENDIEVFKYMYKFLQDNHNPEMLELLDRVHTLNMETDLGWGNEPATAEESEEYFNGKWKLLNYFGVKSDNGDAYID